MRKDQTDFSHFSQLDLRVGRIVLVEDSKAKKPTYRITVDFGDEVGRKVTVGAFRNYPKEELLGKLVIGLVNVGTKKMGEEISEFLMLGAPNERHETIYLTPQADAPLGAEVF
ncbi:MAG: protein secretion chaperonin CsaA [Candidatus Micrarchaeota archaeon]|nr:protein secretion chaperonin CsaA [Candidatus Micrarchaeota archaeon]MDE1851073.1 protein secretion chaperonin CsaA [Candidatus Micrarchaeota archaeon]